MKKIIDCYKNWRIDVLIAVAATAGLLLVSDSATAAETLLVKAAGLILTVTDIALYVHWDRHGLLGELNDVTE